MRLSKLTSQPIVYQNPDDAKYDEAFLIPGLGKGFFNDEDFDLYERLIVLKQSLYNGSLQQALEEVGVTPSVESVAIEGDSILVDGQEVDPFVFLFSLGFRGTGKIYSEVVEEDEEKLEQLLQDFEAKHSKISEKDKLGLTGACILAGTYEAELVYEKIEAIYLNINLNKIVQCSECDALGDVSCFKKVKVDGEKVYMCPKCYKAYQVENRDPQFEAVKIAKIYESVIVLLVLTGFTALSLIFGFLAETPNYILGGSLLGAALFISSYIMVQDVVEKITFSVHKFTKGLIDKVVMGIFNAVAASGGSVVIWLAIVLFVLISAVCFGLPILIPFFYAASFIIGLAAAIIASPVTFVMGVIRTARSFNKDHYTDYVHNVVDVREQAVTQFDDENEYASLKKKNLFRLILAGVLLVIFAVAPVVVSLVLKDMVEPQTFTWVMLGVVALIFFYPTFATLIIGHHKLAYTTRTYLALPLEFLKYYPRVIKCIWAVGEGNPVYRIASIFVEILFIPIGLAFYAIAFVYLFGAALVLTNIIALISLPLSIYRAVKNYNFVSVKSLYEDSEEDPEYDDGDDYDEDE